MKISIALSEDTIFPHHKSNEHLRIITKISSNLFSDSLKFFFN